MLVFSFVISVIIILIFIFLLKVYIVLFKFEKNIRSNFRLCLRLKFFDLNVLEVDIVFNGKFLLNEYSG